uniref:RING-type domain-containing protein n=1 Tax=Glossina brevipalpis TaxID=37001 RepID=A0A1A9WFA3_9MUSC
MSTIHCRFSECQWSGAEKDIFKHLENCHRKFLREPNGRIYFDLNRIDLREELFVLCTAQGLYWLCQNRINLSKSRHEFGLFHLGNSLPVTFTLELRMQGNRYCKQWGPFNTQSENYINRGEERYELNLKSVVITKCPENRIMKRLRLVFDKFDTSTEYIIELYKERYKRLYRLCFQSFTCAICWEFIRDNARFCENTHFVCLNCFNQMRMRTERKSSGEKEHHNKSITNFKCPICRGHYLYDCKDDELESLLRILNWSEVS